MISRKYAKKKRPRTLAADAVKKPKGWVFAEVISIPTLFVCALQKQAL